MKKSIPELVRLLNYYTQKYEEGHPEISDKEWDDMYFELLQDEKEAGYTLPDSPTRIVTTRTVSSLQKKKHNHKMLSLDKTKDLDEVKNFLGKELYLAMCKMDGLTCSLTYYDGNLVAAETRGNGEIGEDILHNAQIVNSIPSHINYTDELVIDGEIISTYDNFKKFNTEYKNPRNFAAGSIRLLDSFECEKRNLTFVAWEVIKGLNYYISNENPETNEYNEREFFITDKKNTTVSSKLCQLTKFGFTVVPFICPYGNMTLQDIEEKLKNKAQELSYPIDGLVFKFDNIEYGKSLGETAHHFKNAIAYKFYDETYDTTLRNIEWSMGRTGVITPIAIFDTVDCDGAEVSRASLHNINVMYDTLHTPFKGQKIQIFKSNMIIPQVYSAEQPETIDNNLIIQVPTICPQCGGSLKVTENEGVKILTCPNEECPGRTLNHLVHFCSKKGLDIKGLSEATLNKLMDWGWVNSPKDLFTLSSHRDEWIKKDGFGVKSVDKILAAIEAARDCDLTHFISSLGIPFIGLTVARLIVEQFPTWEDFMMAIIQKYNFATIPTFGEIKSEALLNFNYTEATKIAKYLRKINTTYTFENLTLTLSTGEKCQPKKMKLYDITFCVTGKLHNYKNRDELKFLIETEGGRVVDSISKKVNYLINNDITSTSGKNKKAKELNIPIISEEDFLTKLDNDLF